MPHVRRLGTEAEDRAAEFLAAQGYTLLTRRYKAAGGELDLVALDGETLAFIEVKRRRRSDPLDSIDTAKQQRIFAAADLYLARYDGTKGEVRFDVVTEDERGLSLHKDAFRPR